MRNDRDKVTRAAAFITCEAVTGISLAAWGVIAGLSSAAVGGYAAYSTGQNAKETAKYNEVMGERKATDALERGADQAAIVRDRARRVAGTQTEGAAMSGVEVNSGTPLALLTETAGLGELDAMRTLNNAKREAWGLSAQSELDAFSGRAAGRAGTLNAGGTLLTGAANSYYGYKSATR